MFRRPLARYYSLVDLPPVGPNGHNADLYGELSAWQGYGVVECFAYYGQSFYVENILRHPTHTVRNEMPEMGMYAWPTIAKCFRIGAAKRDV